MSEQKHATEEQMELIISEYLDDCRDHSNVCEMKRTEEGRRRIIERVKQLIINDGYEDVTTALAKVDDEIGWEKQEQ